jgi:hypothetical protein
MERGHQSSRSFLFEGTLLSTWEWDTLLTQQKATLDNLRPSDLRPSTSISVLASQNWNSFTRPSLQHKTRGSLKSQHIF